MKMLLLFTFASIFQICKMQPDNADESVGAYRLRVPMTMVKNAEATGAFCLDGSLPAYHIHKGFGAGASNWLLQFEGGGWCQNARACKERAPTRRGSTRLMNKWAGFSGILSDKASLNPDFYNWNRVKLRYCDGGSFSGDSELNNGTSVLHFKGQKIWQAIIQDLLPQGLGNAKMALLSGSSAGGLSAILHCDNFSTYLPKATSVKCLSDAGFFMDVSDVNQNRTMRDFFSKLVTVHGAQQNLDNTCTRLHPSPEECIFPQYAVKYIKTPLFVLNAAYDVFQFNHVLVPPSADLHGTWKNCKDNPAACSPDQLTKLQGFRDAMLGALKEFLASPQNGGFINACFAHGQSESQDTWFASNSPRIENKAIAEAVGDWYFNRGVSKRIGPPYPSDTTCHNLIGDKVIANRSNIVRIDIPGQMEGVQIRHSKYEDIMKLEIQRTN